MKRSGPPRRRTPLRGGKPLKSKKKLRAKKRPARKTKLKTTNPKRLKRLRMEQGLDGPKADWIRTLPSCVTGRWGWDENLITVSHVRGTRGAGAKGEGTVPMLWTENTDWDQLDEEAWQRKYGIAKDIVREMALETEATWQRIVAERAA